MSLMMWGWGVSSLRACIYLSLRTLSMVSYFFFMHLMA